MGRVFAEQKMMQKEHGCHKTRTNKNSLTVKLSRHEHKTTENSFPRRRRQQQQLPPRLPLLIKFPRP